jgi:hypothetical protein
LGEESRRFWHYRPRIRDHSLRSNRPASIPMRGTVTVGTNCLPATHTNRPFTAR